MKIVCLLVAALCVCAHAGVVVDNEVAKNLDTRLEFQELHLKASLPDTEATKQDDQLLSAELAELEHTQNRNLVSDAIKNLLNSFRPVIINGNDVLPPLDPLNIAHIGPISHDSFGVRIGLDFYNLNMQGLQWYVVDDLHFNVLRLNLDMHLVLPFLTFTGSYDANARIALIPYRAGGDFRVFVNRVDVEVDSRLGTNIFGGGTLVLRELEVNIKIHDITIQIDGLIGSGILNNMIVSIVESITQSLMTGELETLGRVISEALFDGINDVLGNFTLDDLLGLS